MIAIRSWNSRSANVPWLAMLLGVVHLTGCGNSQVIAHDTPRDSSVPPAVEEQELRRSSRLRSPDGGLVAIADGFDLKAYRTIAVYRFVVTEPNLRYEDDRAAAQSIPMFLQHELVLRLREARLFRRVVDLSVSPIPAESSNTLKLDGSIKVLSAGTQALWDFGARRTNVQIEMRFVEPSSRRTMLITADRSIGMMAKRDAGGDEEAAGERLLRESVRNVAYDVVSFLVRFSKS